MQLLVAGPLIAACLMTFPDIAAQEGTAAVSESAVVITPAAGEPNASRSEFPATSPKIRTLPVTAERIGLVVAYCAGIMLASVLGGYLPSLMTLTHTGTQTIISVVGGFMLGIALFHLLPHATHGLTIQLAVWWMMCGIVTTFLIIRWFHFHHHGPLEISAEKEEPCAGHDHDHDHDHHSDHVQGKLREPFCHHAHQLSWVGIAIGLSLHTLIDGMALAASVQAPMMRPSLIPLAGFGTFIAILAHKPLDAVSITSLMANSGWKSRSRLTVNLLFACMCPIGAGIFLAGVHQLSEMQDAAVCAALAFSAGVFLCIALSDLLPEMEFHSHNQLGLTLALLTGIFLAYGVTFLH
ncbi:MAG: ZIP family metal transporter [Planctomycetota bacterium]